MNEATHGIEIQSMEIDNAITQEYFQQRRKNTESDKEKGKKKGKLELSVGTLVVSMIATTIITTSCRLARCSWCYGSCMSGERT